MLKKIFTLFLFFQALVWLESCVPEEFDTVGINVDEINPEYAVPLIQSELSLDDLVKKSSGFVKKHPDGFVSLIYRGTVYSTTANNAVPIPNQNFGQSISLSSTQAAALSTGQSITIPFQLSGSFAIGNREIDSLWIKSGNLAASISSQIKTGGNLKIIFDDAYKSGAKLSMDIPFSYSGSPVTASKNMSLEGFRWNLSKISPFYNVVNVSFELTLNGTTETVNANEEFNVDFGTSNIKYERFYGYVGSVNLLNTKDTIDLSIFDKATNGQFTIDDAKIKIVCGNSFGADIKAGFTQLAGYSPGVFEDNITGLPASLPIPVPNYSQIGQTLYDSVIIDKNNSNLVTVVNKSPKKVIYQVYFDLNPNGKQQRNFLTEKSQFECIVDVELPLFGSARDFVLESEDSAKLDFDSEDLIESMLLRFTGVNGYPVQLETQLYLLNSNNQIFDSIFTDRSYKFLEAAQVGTDGKVVSATKKTTDIVFNALRAERLKDLRKIKTRVVLATSNTGGIYPNVKLYSNYILGISIGAKAKLKVKIDE